VLSPAPGPIAAPNATPSTMLRIMLTGLATLCYLLTSGLLSARLLGLRDHYVQNRHGPLLIGLGAVALHGVLLTHYLLGGHGLNLGFFNTLSLTGWIIATVLLLTALSQPLENLGVVLFPVAALTLVLGSVFPSEQATADVLPWQIQVHALISIVAYALFTLATLQSLLLTAQHRRLRQRRPGGFLRVMPPLLTTETLLFHLLSAGFVCLSLALLSGFFFLEDIFAQHLVHKTVLSLGAWLIFGTLLWGRWRHGWRGTTIAGWTLAGFCVLMLAYFGSKFVLELLLERYP